MDNKQTLGVILLTSFLAAMGTGVILDDGTPYYCESRDMICIGHRLSDTGKTCYWLVNGTEKGARCTEGWIAYNPGLSELADEVDIYANNCIHHCTYTQTLGSYDICVCDNGQYAYAGELI